MGIGSAIRAGRAYVELFTDASQLEVGLRAAASRLRSFGASVSGMMGRFGGWTRGNASLPEPLQQIAHFATSPAGITTGFTMLTMLAAEFGDALDRMGQQTGVAVDVLSRLQYAATMMDLPFEDVARSIGKMQKNIAANKGGLGRLLGQSADQQLMAVADILSGIHDPALRAARAMEIFGKSGAALLPMLGEGSQKVRDIMAEAGRLGFTADPAEIEKLAQADDAFKRMELSIRNLINTVGASLAPVFTKMADAIGGIVRWVRDFARTNKDAIATIYRVVTSITAVGTAASVLAVVLPSITPLVAGAFAFLGSMITAALSPVGLFITAISLLAGGVTVFSGVLRRTWDAIVSKAATMVGEIIKIFNGAFDAIVGGKFQLAWDIVCKGMELIWAQTMDNLKQAWNVLVDGMGFVLASVWKIWPKIIREAKAAWADFSGWFEKMWNGMLVKLSKGIASAVAGVVEGIGNALDGVWGMGSAGTDLKNAANNIRHNLTYQPARSDKQIDAETEAKKTRLTADQATADAAIERRVAELLAGIKAGRDPAEIARLQTELDALIRQAAGLPEGQKGKRFPGGEVPQLPGVSVTGTFNAAAVSGLGMGGVFQEIKKELIEIKAHMGRLVEVDENTLDELKAGTVYG